MSSILNENTLSPTLLGATQSQFSRTSPEEVHLFQENATTLCLSPTEMPSPILGLKRSLSISEHQLYNELDRTKRTRAASDAIIVAHHQPHNTFLPGHVSPPLFPHSSSMLLNGANIVFQHRLNCSAAVSQPLMMPSPVCSVIPPKHTIDMPTQITSDNGKKSWRIIRHLGKGGCGDVYLAKEENNTKAPFVALKIIKEKKQFLAELATMRQLNRFKADVVARAPKLFCAVRKKRALIMEHLGDNLSMKFEQCGYHFSLKTVLMLMMEMMELSRDFYQKTGLVHVDLKPANYCVGENGRRLSLIDFGYAMQPSTRLPSQTGTPLFMSWTIQTIGRVCPTWQDDLESLGYVLMFFVAGGKKGLPWGALKTHRDIAVTKSDKTIQVFCNSLFGTEYELLASTLSHYMALTRSRLRTFTMADFIDLYRSFESLLFLCGWKLDYDYDWLHLNHVQPLTPVSMTSAPQSPLRLS